MDQTCIVATWSLLPSLASGHCQSLKTDQHHFSAQIFLFVFQVHPLYQTNLSALCHLFLPYIRIQACSPMSHKSPAASNLTLLSIFCSPFHLLGYFGGIDAAGLQNICSGCWFSDLVSPSLSLVVLWHFQTPPMGKSVGNNKAHCPDIARAQKWIPG